MEKYWKIGHFSWRVQPDWGSTAWANVAGLGSIGLKMEGLVLFFGNYEFKTHYICCQSMKSCTPCHKILLELDKSQNCDLGVFISCQREGKVIKFLKQHFLDLIKSKLGPHSLLFSQWRFMKY